MTRRFLAEPVAKMQYGSEQPKKRTRSDWIFDAVVIFELLLAGAIISSWVIS